MNTDWTCLTPNRGDRKMTEEEVAEFLLEMRAIRTGDYLPTIQAMKEQLAAKEASQMRYHKISRWLKRMETEDPAVLFPG
jgi:hypothetical protein